MPSTFCLPIHSGLPRPTSRGRRNRLLSGTVSRESQTKVLDLCHAVNPQSGCDLCVQVRDDGRGRRSGRTRRFRVTWSRRGVGPSGGNGTTGQRKVPVTPHNNCNTPMSRGTQDNHATAWGRSSNSRAHRCRQSHRRGGRGGGGGSGSRARSTANRQSQKPKAKAKARPVVSEEVSRDRPAWGRVCDEMMGPTSATATMPNGPSVCADAGRISAALILCLGFLLLVSVTCCSWV